MATKKTSKFNCYLKSHSQDLVIIIIIIIQQFFNSLRRYTFFIRYAHLFY